jgi:hypothetical protein
MSIETLMTTANAAGYVMAVEEELPDTFGRKPSIFEFRKQPSTALAISRPIVPDLDGKPLVSGYGSSAWHWFTGRFAGGVTA